MKNDIHRLRLTLSEKRLSSLIDKIQKSIDEGPIVDASCLEELEKYKKQVSYMRMYAFGEKKDPYRQKVFDETVRGLQRLSRDILKCTRIELSTDLRMMKMHAPEFFFDLPEIKANLEDYVTSMTMASMTGENVKSIIDGHNRYIRNLFDLIVTGSLWNEAKKNIFSEALSSSTIDPIDAQVLVSAITISTLFVSDEQKIETLINIYETSTNENVKGRAFTGWVLALHSIGGMCDTLNKRVAQLLKNKDVVKELLELQMNILYCADTEKDTDVITRDIMPGILNDRRIVPNRFGIILDDEENDIKNLLQGSIKEEQSLEALEKNFERIQNMRKSGSDVYFGGFAKMKNFAFFYPLINWFYPFTENHPEICKLAKQVTNDKILKMIEKFPFCDSDKYSFAFSMSSVYNQLPNEIKDLLNSDVMSASPEMQDEDTSLANKRRLYLQDLYRFFKINKIASNMDNPYKETNGLLRGFFFDDYFLCCDETIQAKQSLARFLVKRRPDGEELNLLLDSYESNSLNDKLLRADHLLQQGDKGGVAKALEIYREAYLEDKERNIVLRGMVRCLSHLERYEEACKYSEELLMHNPDSKGTQLNHSILLIKCEREAEANKILFKLNYENPDDRNVLRVLAWCLLMEDKTEKSVDMFERVINSGKTTTVDNLNMGLAKWVSGKEQEAADYFVKYVEVEDLHKLTHEFDDEREFLQKHDILEVDVCMMLDLVEERTKKA